MNAKMKRKESGKTIQVRGEMNGGFLPGQILSFTLNNLIEKEEERFFAFGGKASPLHFSRTFWPL